MRSAVFLFSFWLLLLPAATFAQTQTDKVIAANTVNENNLILENLLDRLQVAPSSAEADLLAEEVWARFYDSGSASVDLLLQRGIAAQAQGQLDLAADFFADVVEFAPNFAEGWNRRAGLEYLRGEYVAAMEDLAKAIELQPRHFGAMVGLGLILERLGSAEGAYQAFSDALVIYPFSAEAKAGVERLEKQVKGRQL